MQTHIVLVMSPQICSVVSRKSIQFVCNPRHPNHPTTPTGVGAASGGMHFIIIILTMATLGLGSVGWCCALVRDTGFLHILLA